MKTGDRVFISGFKQTGMGPKNGLKEDSESRKGRMTSRRSIIGMIVGFGIAAVAFYFWMVN